MVKVIFRTLGLQSVECQDIGGGGPRRGGRPSGGRASNGTGRGEPSIKRNLRSGNHGESPKMRPTKGEGARPQLEKRNLVL